MVFLMSYHQQTHLLLVMHYLPCLSRERDSGLSSLFILSLLISIVIVCLFEDKQSVFTQQFQFWVIPDDDAIFTVSFRKRKDYSFLDYCM